VTKQETFDHIVRSLIAQGKPARTPGGGQCKYRVFEGDVTLKCAAGHCIPDEKYDPVFEGAIVYACGVGEGSSEKTRLLHDALEGWDLEVLEALQVAHDVTSPGEDWLAGFVREARSAAYKLGLDASLCEAAA
jgi:hypothetical protein